MPELPEVETMRRGVAAIAGATIRDVERPACKKRPILIYPRIDRLRKRVQGVKIAGLGRVGKRVILELATGDRLIFEPRMSGLVLLADPPTAEHLRFRAKLSGVTPPELLYWDRRGLGSVRLLSPQEFAEQLGPERIGPDALAMTPGLYAERLGKSQRAVKVALLDQKAVSGIGNLYASEILHLSAIHPTTPCRRLRAKHWELIHAATVEVLELAILHEGSTLSDGTYRNVLNQDGGYQNMHRVYDKEGQVCGRCGKGEVVRVVQAQRSTFFCPRCQKKRG